MKNARCVIILSLFCTLISTSRPFAHDLIGVLREKENYQDLIRQTNKLWDKPNLKVCFSDGPATLRPEIAAAMLEWTSLTKVNLSFVFGEHFNPINGTLLSFYECDGITPFNIRIGFIEGRGHRSFIGTDSEEVFPDNSMNIDIADIARGGLYYFMRASEKLSCTKQAMPSVSSMSISTS